MIWFFLVEFMEDGNLMINILFEDNHLLVVEKPVNVPVQADISGDDDLLSILKKYIKEKYDKPGNVYLGLVHRLDRPVGGVMVFAKTSKAAKRISSQIVSHDLKKYYYAVVCGKIERDGVFKDKLLKDSKLNKSFVSPLGKDAELSYRVVDYSSDLSLVDINLKTGRSHQIRVQFSHHGYPLYGDQKYNENATLDSIALYAYKLEFIHPITKEKMVFELPLPNRYPFNLFKTSEN